MSAGEHKTSEQTFASILRDLRGSRTQEQVAAAVGRTQTCWSYWETGKREPSLADLESLPGMGLRLADGQWFLEVQR